MGNISGVWVMAFFFVLLVGGFLLVMWRRPRTGKDSDQPRGGDPNADTRSHGSA